MSGPKNANRPAPAARWASDRRIAARLASVGLAAALLLALCIAGPTACSSDSSSIGSASAPAGEFVQGGTAPAPAATPRPIGPAPVPEK